MGGGGGEQKNGGEIFWGRLKRTYEGSCAVYILNETLGEGKFPNEHMVSLSTLYYYNYIILHYKLVIENFKPNYFYL